jgi:starvation-inducible DNA-binding protein
MLELPVRKAATPADALQQTLVELIELAMQGKQAHWNVEGPLFKPVHELLDEMVDQQREWYDDVAERLTAIGHSADGRSATVAEMAHVAPLPDGPIDAEVAIDAFEARVGDVARRVSERAAAIETDLGTQDLLVEVLRGLEKQRWMLRASRAGAGRGARS